MTGPAGDIGEEARALVAAARDWVVRTIPDSHSAECQWCPLCRTVAALRDPDVADRVAGAVGGVAGTLASFLDALTRPAPPPPPVAPRPPAVQDIPLDDPAPDIPLDAPAGGVPGGARGEAP